MRLNWTKEHRLLKKPEFDHCFEQGTKVYTKNFILFVCKHGTGPGGVRLGLTVSKKAGCAVVRNRIKRVIREFFRLNQEQFHTPVDIIFIPKKSLKGKKITLELATNEIMPVIDKINKKIKVTEH